MPEQLEQAVVESTTMVMETSAFMTIWQWTEEDGDLPQPDIAATITFTGARDGRLTLRLASEVLPLLSKNMLGDFDESEPSPDAAQDALKEMLNMMCGNVLTAWYGSDPVFKLHPPEVLTPEAEATPESAATPDICVKFNLENTLCIVEACIVGGVEDVNPAAMNVAASGEKSV